jgi:hypothetical protein
MKLALFLFVFSLPLELAAQQATEPQTVTQEAVMQEAATLELPETPQPVSGYSSSAEFQQAGSPPQAGSLPQAPAEHQETAAERKAAAARELKQEESQRMLGVIPNFNSVMSGHAEPLSPGQKFHLFFKGSVDPFQFVAAGIDSAIEQGENSYPEYKQGFKGYAKRYGASYADGFDGNFWGNAVLPSLFHQDPRYFRLGTGTFMHRLLYSVETTVRTKGDNGKWQPNYSNVLGNLIGGSISNVYYPASDRGVGLTLERGFTVSAEGAIGSLAVEFYPDVVRHYQQRKAAKQAAAASRAAAQQP